MNKVRIVDISSKKVDLSLTISPTRDDSWTIGSSHKILSRNDLPITHSRFFPPITSNISSFKSVKQITLTSLLITSNRQVGHDSNQNVSSRVILLLNRFHPAFLAARWKLKSRKNSPQKERRHEPNGRIAWVISKISAIRGPITSTQR